MKPFLIVLPILLVASFRSQPSLSISDQAREIKASIGNGQPETVRVPVYNFFAMKLIPAAEPSKQVTDVTRCMLQDNEGNTWFGTNSDGVCRYDGKRFRYFNVNNGLAGNSVRSMVLDSKGNIWMATNGGLSRYDGCSFTNFTMKEGLPSDDAWSLLWDSKGMLWAGTMNGVCLYNGAGFTLPCLPISNIPNSFSRFTPKLVWNMYEDNTGAVWFGTDGNGVIKYDGNGFTRITMAEGLAGNNVLSVTQDKAGNMWFGTWGNGLCRYNANGFTVYTKNQGLAGNHAWSLLTDKEGNLWIGTVGGGISRFNGKEFTSYREDQGLTQNNVQCIMQDKKGGMWFGFSGGIFRLQSSVLINFLKSGEGC
jgi:ligand-binding sensor domain-containing protein